NLFSVSGFSSGGLFDVTFSADNTYSGTTTVSAGVPGFLRLYVLGNQPNSAVTGGSISQNAQVSGTGTIGARDGVLRGAGHGRVDRHPPLDRERPARPRRAVPRPAERGDSGLPVRPAERERLDDPPG